MNRCARVIFSMSYMREKVHNTHIGQKVALTDSEACSVPEENPEGKEQKR